VYNKNKYFYVLALISLPPSHIRVVSIFSLSCLFHDCYLMIFWLKMMMTEQNRGDEYFSFIGDDQMGWMLAVAVFLVGVIIFLWLSRLYIHCSLIYGKGKQSVIVTLRLYGIRIFTKEIMIGKEKGKTANKRKKQTAGKNPRDEIKQLQDGIKNFFIMIHDS